ncbi:hypothetical protein JVT61DRAFT_13619 [Boletus reticuloceps]|uniref:Uncharacterized protein n=1 Tax=Boletus reticuloceps TaxID=495285 RepID=A0A8I2YDB9_9AGAM|nr:hypothetical protein JVT61DRAFT_13619 [Boletus reticuloceps]
MALLMRVHLFFSSFHATPMSSQIPNSDTPLDQATRSELTCGWMRQPSEKVQAMLDEQESTKCALEHQAHEKAIQCKTLACKREQASKVAETDPFMAPTLKTPTRRQFTMRSVGSVHATQATSCPAMLTAPLMARQGKVPPASTTPKLALPAQLSHMGQPAVGTLDKQTAYQGSHVNAKSANIAGAHGQTPVQATKSEGLKWKKAYFNVADASPPKKQARAWLPSPYLSASQVVSAEFGDLSIGDENQSTQAQDAPTLEKDASKLLGHSVATKDEVESKPSVKTVPEVSFRQPLGYIVQHYFPMILMHHQSRSSSGPKLHGV